MTEKPTDWPPGVTAEKLMAYADGALDSHEAQRLAELIAANPELQAEVDAYVDSRTMLEGVYDDVLDEPVPEHLEALVMAPKAIDTGGDNVVAFRAAKTQRPPVQRFGGWGQAVAASVLLAIGGIIGSQLSGKPSPSLIVAGLLAADHPLSIALETAPSNTLVDSGGERFEAIQTFATAEGTVCREYESGNLSAGVVGIACRDAAGWHVEVVVADPNAAVAGGDGYRPASGLDVTAIDEVLTGMGALPGFDSAGEECLLANDWDIAACEK